MRCPLLRRREVNGMGAIRELYHGRLGPSHSIKPDNIRYHQLLVKCSELREKLEPELSEDHSGYQIVPTIHFDRESPSIR